MTAALTTYPTTSWDLVERAQAGDREAFGDLYRHYHPMIAGWIYKGTGDAQLTKDLTADVFVRALASIGNVAWRGKDIGAWLHTIARNRLADHWKSARVRLERLHGATPGFEEADDCEQLSVREPTETAAVAYLARIDLLTAIKALRPDHRQVIVLRFLNDLTLDETAAIMGRTKGAIKCLQHRALESLRRNETVVALAVAA